MPIVPVALDLGFAEIERTGAAEFGEPIERFALRPEHRVDQMQAATRIGEDMRDEQALIDLVAVFRALLHQRALGRDAVAGR